MTPFELAFHIREQTKTNATTFPDANILSLVKIYKDEIARRILEADEDTFILPQNASLVVNQREYSFGSDVLARMKRVEAKLNGTDWVKLVEMDLSGYKHTTDEATIVNYFSNEEGEAKYDITRKSLWIYSGAIIDVTDGLKLWVNTYPAEILDLSSTTEMNIDPSATTHGLPREFHELLARKIIINYKENREKPIPLTQTEQNYEQDMLKAISTLRHGSLDREVFGSVPENDGSQY